VTPGSLVAGGIRTDQSSLNGFQPAFLLIIISKKGNFGRITASTMARISFLISS
jgi:hypothetical protein